MPPLQPQLVEVRFGKLDKKTSDKLAVPGTLAVAQNLDVVETGKYQRRSGTAVYDDVVGATRLHAGEREFLVGTPGTLFSDLDGVFANRGAISGVRSDHTPINVSTFEQANHDFVRHDGLDWHVWEEDSGIYYAVRDSATGAYLVVDGVITQAADRRRPRIFAAGAHVLVTYYDASPGAPNNRIAGRRIATATPTSVGGETGIGTLAAFGGEGYDAIFTSGTTLTFAFLVAIDGASPPNVGLRLRNWNVATMAAGTTVTSTTLGQMQPAVDAAISIVRFDATAGYHVVFVYKDTAAAFPAQVNLATAPADLSAAPTVVNIFASSAHTNAFDLRNCTGWVDGAGTTHILVDVESSAADGRERIHYWTRTSGGSISGPNVLYGRRLMCQAFTFLGRVVFLASATVATAAGNESTLFLIDGLTGAMVGRALPSLAAEATEDYGWLPRALVTDVVEIPVAYAATTEQNAAALLVFEELEPARWLEIAGVTLVPGSTIHLYDGIGVSELGFHFKPVNTASATPGGGSLASGDYWYRAHWSWVDATGRLHRGPPCDAFKVTAALNDKAQLTWESLTVTLKSAPVQQAVLQVFRSTVNPSAAGAAAMFLVATVPNDPSLATFVVEDPMSDATLITQERLYTLGNTVLANTPPPPANGLTAWGDRVWAWERDVLWFSKVIVDDFGVAFSDEQYIQIIDDRGDIVAAADGGPRLAIFKRTGIYTVSGDGPNDVGQGTFSPVKRMAVPLGARAAASVVSTEIGVFFQDDASGHIWLLPPDGLPTPIGRDVEPISSGLTITDSVVVPERRQVRFFSLEGTTLIYDLTHEQWRTATEQPAEAAAVVGDLLHYVTSAGEIRQEDPEAWTEGADSPGTVTPDAEPMTFGQLRPEAVPDLTVRLATTGALPTVTPAGTGVGKTLTKSTNGALTVDGVAAAAADLVLVKNQASAADNGVYTVTNPGSAGAPFVLTRATGFDQVGETTPGKIIGVSAGATLEGSRWMLLDDGTPYQAVLESTWLSLAGVGGYQRTYAMQATGENRGPHELGCTLGYRFGDAEDVSAVDASVLDDDEGYRVEARPAIKHQRSTAIKIRLEDNSPPTAGFALEALNLTVGLRPGRARTPRSHITNPETP